MSRCFIVTFAAVREHQFLQDHLSAVMLYLLHHDCEMTPLLAGRQARKPSGWKEPCSGAALFPSDYAAEEKRESRLKKPKPEGELTPPWSQPGTQLWSLPWLHAQGAGREGDLQYHLLTPCSDLVCQVCASPDGGLSLHLWRALADPGAGHRAASCPSCRPPRVLIFFPIGNALRGPSAAAPHPGGLCGHREGVQLGSAKACSCTQRRAGFGPSEHRRIGRKFTFAYGIEA
ncbi:COP9 signalosome complex subunit 7b isoform X2 [Calonectris borealis]|uniref:COP9 signalosome complex subunit 7b isoform X2 n=1 Tax=Calonectris borealis TaxID=1323832 RepID=UPI003F4B6744